MPTKGSAPCMPTQTTRMLSFDGNAPAPFRTMSNGGTPFTAFSMASISFGTAASSVSPRNFNVTCTMSMATGLMPPPTVRSSRSTFTSSPMSVMSTEMNPLNNPIFSPVPFTHR